MPPSFCKHPTAASSVPQGWPAAENEKEQISLLTAKIAGKLPVAAQLVVDKRKNLAFSMADPSHH
jgi:hypothetical protein